MLDSDLSTHSRTTANRRASLRPELERPSHHPHHLRPFRVGWGGKPDEAGVLSRALEKSTVVVELPTAVKDQARMPRKGADPDDILAVDFVADQLPHIRLRARRLALSGALRGVGRRRLRGAARRLHDEPDARGELLQLCGKGNLRRRRHLLELYYPQRI